MFWCSQFRIFIAILAAFAPYFAFICRYNLSIVIEEMVVKNGTLAATNVTSNTTTTPTLLKPQVAASASDELIRELARPPWWTGKSGDASNRTRRQVEMDVSLKGATGTPTTTTTTKANEYQHLKWSEEDKNSMLGAFFVTYSLAQVPAGRAAEIYGAKTLLLVVGFGAGLGSLLFPYAVHWSSTGFLPAYAIRLLLGFCQAGMFPAIYVLLCEWLPKLERSSWLAVPSAMGRIGTISMNLLVPLILHHFNWQMVFTIFACATLTWSLFVLVFVSDSPASSRWLNRSELHYIQTRMEPTGSVGVGGKAQVGSLCLGTSLPPPTATDHLEPATSFTQLNKTIGATSGVGGGGSKSLDLFKVLTNRPVWVLTLVMFSADWTNMLLLTKLPGFLSSAMRMQVEEISVLSSLLVGVYCFCYPLSGWIASRLEQAKIGRLNSLNIRKLFETIAHILQALGCLLIAFSPGQHKSLVIMALFIMMLGRSSVGGGQCQMPPELSKEFPGTVMAIANSIGSISGVLGPYTISMLVSEATQYDSWRHLWTFSAGLYIIAGLIFLLVADNSPQDFGKLELPAPAVLYLPPYIPPPPQPSTPPAQQVDSHRKPAKVGRRAAKQRAFQDEILARMDTFSRDPTALEFQSGGGGGGGNGPPVTSSQRRQ